MRYTVRFLLVERGRPLFSLECRSRERFGVGSKEMCALCTQIRSRVATSEPVAHFSAWLLAHLCETFSCDGRTARLADLDSTRLDFSLRARRDRSVYTFETTTSRTLLVSVDMDTYSMIRICFQIFCVMCGIKDPLSRPVTFCAAPSLSDLEVVHVAICRRPPRIDFFSPPPSRYSSSLLIMEVSPEWRSPSPLSGFVYGPPDVHARVFRGTRIFRHVWERCRVVRLLPGASRASAVPPFYLGRIRLYLSRLSLPDEIVRHICSLAGLRPASTLCVDISALRVQAGL